MLYKHAVVYTLDYTWTTLRDKSLDIAEIDKICEVHLAYMGYGKFANITRKDENVTVGIQPTLQTLSVRPKAQVPTPKQPINRTRHGHHPTRTASAHINYFDLNHGDSTKERKSPRKQKRRSVSALTLRTPSESRLASQSYIEREKEKQTVESQTAKDLVTDTDIQITATLSPVEDGTPFTRSHTPKSHPVAVKTPSTSRAVPKPKQHEPEPPQSKAGNTIFETPGREAANQHEKDKHISQTAQTTTENEGGEKDEQSPKSSTPLPTAQPVQEINKETSSNKITTTAEINLCGKHFHLSQQLLPLINPSTIKQEDTHTPNVVSTLDPECEKDEREKDERINDRGTKTEKPLLANPVPGSVSTTTDTHILRTPDKKIEIEKQCSQPVSDDHQDRAIPLQSFPSSEPDERQQDNLHSQEQHENETDEQKRQAADGLLMLQELARFDDFDTEEDANSQLMPIGTALIESNLDTAVHDAADHTTTSAQPITDDTSDETIIYDTVETVPETNPPAPTPSKTDREKDEQPSKHDRDKKGKLIIRNVGIKKGGTQQDTENDTPMPTITSSGKVRCNFCRRAFDTLTEQKQHMSRRHPDQLREQEEKRKREKDERIEREQFKQAIEALKKQELEKQKRRKNPIRKSERSHEKDEPSRKRQKTTDKTTSSQRRYNCPSEDCNRSFNTQAELNRHHKDNHPPVKCTVCKKICSTPNTLDRHMYKHWGTLKCQYCDEKFAFQSELEIHQTVHDEEPSFYCKSCTRSFMRLGDLREHEESHTGDVHYCTVKGCNFSAPLKRYVRTHIKTTHASKNALPYPCTKCNERFKFYEQRKRHIANYHS